mgnify:CR=1 FL=1
MNQLKKTIQSNQCRWCKWQREINLRSSIIKCPCYSLHWNGYDFLGTKLQEPDEDMFFSKLSSDELSRQSWALDGNYTRTIPIEWEKTQVVIWLDYSLFDEFLHLGYHWTAFPKLVLKSHHRRLSGICTSWIYPPVPFPVNPNQSILQFYSGSL